MDTLVLGACRRLLWLPFALLLVLFSSASFASFPATDTNTGCGGGYPCQDYATTNFATGSPTIFGFANYAAACTAVQANGSAWSANYNFVNARISTGSTCLVDLVNKSNGAAVTTSSYTMGIRTLSAPAYSCPSSSTLSGGQCTCTAPAVQNAANNACISGQAIHDENCKAIANSLNLIGAPLVHFGAVGVTACYGGYSITGAGGASGSLDGAATQSEVYGPFNCPAVPAPCSAVPKPAGQTQCQPGEYPGTVNGVSVCAPSSNTNTIQSPKTTTVAPTTAGQPAPTLEGAPAGATSKTETTECVGGKCTTTTTFKNAAGDPVGTTTKEESKGALCERDPAAPGCVADKSKFSGSCGGGFVGTGDALQKATAEAVNKTNCLLDPGTSIDAVKTALANGTFGPELSNTTRAVGQFDQTNPLGSTCPADFTFSVMTALITVPLSQACWALQALGYIAVAFTLLYSTIFVVKGF